MDVQLILVLTLTVLSISIAAVCFYVINVLKDIKDTVKRANNILDDAQGLTAKLAHPTPTLINIAESTINAVKSLKEITSKTSTIEKVNPTPVSSESEYTDVELEIEIEEEVEVVDNTEKKKSRNVREQITNLFDMPNTKEKNFFKGTFKQ